MRGDRTERACAGEASCVGGQCECPVVGETLCGEVCVDTLTDGTHCGGCDRPCLSPRSCGGGVCDCPGGSTFCDGLCVDTLTDPAWARDA